jgi:hypothetical protein
MRHDICFVTQSTGGLTSELTTIIFFSELQSPLDQTRFNCNIFKPLNKKKCSFKDVLLHFTGTLTLDLFPAIKVRCSNNAKSSRQMQNMIAYHPFERVKVACWLGTNASKLRAIFLSQHLNVLSVNKQFVNRILFTCTRQ